MLHDMCMVFIKSLPKVQGMEITLSILFTFSEESTNFCEKSEKVRPRKTHGACFFHLYSQVEDKKKNKSL